DQTADQYQKVFDDLVPKGYRPATIAAYPTADGPRFGIVMVRGGGNWEARHNLTAAAYQKEFDKHTGKGLFPQQVVGYLTPDGIRYAAVWSAPTPMAKKGPLPMQGAAVPALAAFDDTMQKFMQDRGIQAGALAVMKNGKLILARGYGWRDPKSGTLLGPDTP